MNCKKLGVLVLLTFLTVPASAQLVLPKLISDGMVLQRNEEVKIWGWADPEESVEVTFLDSVYTTTANGSGEWAVHLHPAEAGGPYDIEVESGNRQTIKDVMVGEVWIASGQSNMELSMYRVSPLYKDEIATANYPDIRYFEVPKRYDFDRPAEDLSSGEWVPADTTNILQLSAVSYFYAKHLHETLGVPVGIINSSLGGSPVEAWMSEEALEPFSAHYQEALRFKDDNLIEQIETADQQRISQWHETSFENDAGYQAKEPWYSTSTDDSDWNTMTIPGFWADEEAGPVNGVVWFRREIEIPESVAGKSAKLEMGRIVDADSVFVNGVFVGNTTYQYPPRWYDIPGDLLKQGKNQITVRVVNERGRGGFFFDKPYEITNGTDTIDLKGKWKYRVGTEMEPLQGQTFVRWKPLGLYNAMIAPLTDYRIKGAIWYQGESNADQPQEYHELFSAMIADWREKFGQGEFPFLYVQLPNFMEPSSEPDDSNWALLREAQLNTLTSPNTGMAIAIDIGEWNDIHPLNKKDVANRLALAARNIAYNEDLEYSGPVYQSMRIEEDKIRLFFDHTGSGLTVLGGDELNHFAIAGEDGEFKWAQAEIDGDEVVVWNDDIKKPLYVRYAWADNPENANLYNKEGLPASPFRTDDG